MTDDVIDHLAGIMPGSALDTGRALRPQARASAQASYDALFTPVDDAEMPVAERFAVASFVTGLHGQPDSAKFYADKLAGTGASDALRAAIRAEIAHGAGHGPYGHYPKGPLSVEDVAGPQYQVSDASRAVLGARLAAAFAHAHMLVFHPRDAAAAPLHALEAAGWSTTGIVTFSQLVAFLAYQVRVAAGLRVLAAAEPKA